MLSGFYTRYWWINCTRTVFDSASSLLSSAVQRPAQATKTFSTAVIPLYSRSLAETLKYSADINPSLTFLFLSKVPERIVAQQTINQTHDKQLIWTRSVWVEDYLFHRNRCDRSGKGSSLSPVDRNASSRRPCLCPLLLHSTIRHHILLHPLKNYAGSSTVVTLSLLLKFSCVLCSRLKS